MNAMRHVKLAILMVQKIDKNAKNVNMAIILSIILKINIIIVD